MPEATLGSITKEQYKWLRARLDSNTDAEALAKTDVTKETLRYWKKSPSFASLLEIVRTDRLSAFVALTTSLFPLALDSLEWLMRSEKGNDKKAGLEIMMKVIGMGRGSEKAEDLVTLLLQVLNVRGAVDSRVLDALGPVGGNRLLPPSRTGNDIKAGEPGIIEGTWRG